ncbi:hypothetical protein TRFO_42869 [Tritrichomonas foetus]|uniref:Uncharacterized protein n=1 Tax=Tritrichomonas foetus TaxID=1144522 RepID=A0A1J4KZ47_9EUKA|nr:hypothetical protein TRFO_42869 [Tritrichomonas foetus]|eukprot:OHT14861.1 hypothetical protein TRFO_42869 [Tritrichomonas foetus]
MFWRDKKSREISFPYYFEIFHHKLMSNDILIINDNEINSSPIPDHENDGSNAITINSEIKTSSKSSGRTADFTKPLKSKKSKSKADKTECLDEIDEISFWSEAKRQSWAAINTNPNAFYYRHCAPGQKKKTGAWSDEEKKLFMEVIKVHPPSQGKWGLLAMHIPGRVGYQCRNYYHRLLETGELVEENPPPSAKESPANEKKKKSTSPKKSSKAKPSKDTPANQTENPIQIEPIDEPPKNHSHKNKKEKASPDMKEHKSHKSEKEKKSKSQKEKQQSEKITLKEMKTDETKTEKHSLRKHEKNHEKHHKKHHEKKHEKRHEKHHKKEAKNEITCYLESDSHISNHHDSPNTPLELNSQELPYQQPVVLTPVYKDYTPEIIIEAVEEKPKWTPRMENPWSTVQEGIEEIVFPNEPLKVQDKPEFEFEVSQIMQENYKNPLNAVLFSFPAKNDRNGEYINSVRSHLLNDDQQTKNQLLRNYIHSYEQYCQGSSIDKSEIEKKYIHQMTTNNM